jgi:hypothetical protein
VPFESAPQDSGRPPWPASRWTCGSCSKLTRPRAKRPLRLRTKLSRGTDPGTCARPERTCRAVLLQGQQAGALNESPSLSAIEEVRLVSAQPDLVGGRADKRPAQHRTRLMPPSKWFRDRLSAHIHAAPLQPEPVASQEA